MEIKRLFNHKEVIMTESDIQKQFGPIVQSIFTDDDRKEFWYHARSDYQEDRFVAGMIFSTFWISIVANLFEAKTPVTLEEALEFFSFYLKDGKGEAPNYFEIWSKVLYDDMETFLTFSRMRQDLNNKRERSQAKTKKAQSKIDRESTLRRLIRLAFMSTVRQSPTQHDRLLFVFFEDLKRLVGYIAEYKIPTTELELKELIKEEVPILRGSQDMLSYLGRFKESLASVTSGDFFEEPVLEIKAEEVNQAVDEYEKEEIIELTQEVEDLPESALQPLETKKVELKIPVLDAETKEVKIQPVIYEISLKGLIQAIKTVEFFGNVKDYNERMQELYHKIMLQCRDNKIQFGLLRKRVYELKEYLRRKKNKMDTTNLSPQDENFLRILDTIGPFEAKISELMPSTFEGFDSCKIQ